MFDFERPEVGERAILVHVEFKDELFREDLTEFKELVASAGVEAVAIATTRRQKPETRYFTGTGKAEEIRDLVKAHAADVVLFDHTLSPSQERNIEALVQCRVLDRTGLSG